MAVSLSLISYFLYLDIKWTPRLVVLFVMIYNAAFGYSWGPIPWLYPPEILPLSIRSKGASLSTATNWAANWLVGEMTPQRHLNTSNRPRPSAPPNRCSLGAVTWEQPHVALTFCVLYG